MGHLYHGYVIHYQRVGIPVKPNQKFIPVIFVAKQGIARSHHIRFYPHGIPMVSPYIDDKRHLGPKARFEQMRINNP
jgi:hypothetical protein